MRRYWHGSRKDHTNQPAADPPPTTTPGPSPGSDGATTPPRGRAVARVGRTRRSAPSDLRDRQRAEQRPHHKRSPVGTEAQELQEEAQLEDEAQELEEEQAAEQAQSQPSARHTRDLPRSGAGPRPFLVVGRRRPGDKAKVDAGLTQPDGQPTLGNPTLSEALPGPAPIGVPNFFIDKFRIPPFLLPIYQAAGIEYGVRWEILAAINEIETDYGRNLNVSTAGAVGWMQFMPSTWKRYGVDANDDGRRTRTTRSTRSSPPRAT